MPDFDKSATVIRIVDDDKDMLWSWRFLLENEGYGVRTYESAEDYLARERGREPGCLLLDVRMPGMNGLQLQTHLNELGSRLPIIFISAHGDIGMAVGAMQEGAFSFLEKTAPEDVVLSAIDKAIAKNLSEMESFAQIEQIQARYEELTDRERDVVELVAQGLANKDIAERLGIAEKTVKVHRGNATRKLGVKNGAEITKLLLQMKPSR